MSGLKLAERFFYDFSLYRMYFSKFTSYEKYVAARHNLLIGGGFYALLTYAMPFRAAFPTMGLCPGGYDGTWVCEPDDHKALELYKAWKSGKGWKPDLSESAPAH